MTTKIFIGMNKDEVYEKTNGGQVIEILVSSIWVPAMATDLRIVNKNIDLVRVEAIRVRDLRTKPEDNER